MAVHGVAFFSAADQAALTPIPPLADETVFVSGNDLMVPAGHSTIVGAAAIGANLDRAVLDSPMIREISRYSVSPVDAAALPTSYFEHEVPLPNPLPVNPGEALNALVSNSGGAAIDKTVAVWLSDGPVNPITGANIRTVRGTTDFDTVADSWTNGQITLETDLPAGMYNVVGFRAESPTGILARLIFPTQGLRPMTICRVNGASYGDPIFRFGRLGVLGQFQNFVPPRLEVFSSGADTDPTVYLDVVKA